MDIIVASTAGFCFGVNRAVESVYKNLDHMELYTYGPIIHNKQVVEDLSNRGVKSIEHLDEIDKGTVIIRSHGVTPEVYAAIESKQLEYIDSTCPYVKRIHKIVQEYEQLEYQIVIVGNPSHPEVQGINGWSNYKSYIIQSADELETCQLNPNKPICIVAQTTYQLSHFEAIIDVLKQKGYDVTVFNTICNATAVRQKEAEDIARKVNKMIVIGGRHSSNTQKLYQICMKYCPDTFHIETIEDLELNLFTPNDKIGITAGASTPKNIIEEVISTMKELENNNGIFEELLDQSMMEQTLHRGQIIKGTVLQVNQNEVAVNIGYKFDGIISKGEFSNDPNLVLKNEVNVGEEIEAIVMRVDYQEGHVLLSKKRVDFQKGWEYVEEAFRKEEILKGKVVEVVKGGVIALVKEIRVFIPASQLTDHFVSNLNEFFNKEIEFKLIEVNKRRHRVIGSGKIIIVQQKEAQKSKVLETIEKGKKVTGTVKSITNFGAFIDLGGIDGLLHISEMSWGKVKHPNKLLKEGQEIEVLVLEVDKENEKISLTIKTPENDPWRNIEEKYPMGSIVEGKVVRMTSFGAFVELEPGVDGLIHISQIAPKHIEKPEDELSIGQKVKIRVLDLNVEERKISLSIKALDKPEGTVQEENTEKEELESNE